MNLNTLFDQEKGLDIHIVKGLWKMFMKRRYVIYTAVFFFVLVHLLNKVPYINLLILPNNIFIYSFIGIMILGTGRADRIMYISLCTFVLQAIFVLLQKPGIADQLANGAYIAIVIAVILFIRNFKKYA